MENLVFTKQDSGYVAEFTATGDFNLHIEKKEKGGVFFYQKSIYDGEYVPIKDIKFDKYDFYLDTDFSALVYPKYIKIVSNAIPEVAVVTFA